MPTTIKVTKAMKRKIARGKRKAARTRRWRKGTSIVPRTKYYGFSRATDELVALENPTAGGASDWIQTTDDCVVKTFVFALDELPSYGEFQGLFSQYKLNMAIVKIFPSYSQIVSTDAAVTSNNIIITIWPNRTGVALDAAFSRDDLDQIQAKRQFLLPINKPTTIKMPLNQLSGQYGGGVNVTDYAVVKPRYVATSEATTPHYGFNVHITKVDKSAFTTNSVRLLMKERLYLTCRGVK